jgi:hypothetical protein
MSRYLQEFAATIDHLAYRAYVDSVEQLINREGAHAFADRVRERDLRQQLLLVGARGH